MSRTAFTTAIGLTLSALLCLGVMAQDSGTGQVPTAITAQAINAPSKKTTEVKKGNWLELTVRQQRALAPLSPLWSSLSEPQRSKWLAISKNFASLPESEQITMHSRMAEWATLTPQQRTQARLNFGETSKIPQSDKKAKWQAYQALSETEKRQLGASQPTPVMGAAPAQRPAASDKLSHVQMPNGQPPTKGKTPGVKALDQKTLLPSAKPAPAKVDTPAT